MLNKILVLSRPLAVVDYETTGIDPKVDRVIQASVEIHYPEKDPILWKSYINPGIPIPNLHKHKVTEEHVKDAPPFSHHAPGLAKHLLGADFCGYNGDFDMDFTRAEMERAGVDFPWDNHIVDPYPIYKKFRGHTLTNCYLEYGGEDGNPLPPDTKIDEAHDAGFDVYMTVCSLRGQLLRNPNIPRTIKELAAFCKGDKLDRAARFIWVENDVVFNFGKWRGKRINDPNPQIRSYLKWISGDAGFKDDAREIAADALLGVFPEK